MKEYLVSPGATITLADGSPGAPFSVVSADPGNPHTARLLRSGRLIERGDAPASFAALDDSDLAAAVQDATVPEVLAAVGDDADLASRVLAIEEASDKPRKSVTDALKETSA